jgi:nitroreductase
MNPTLEVIARRKSTRAFSEQPLTEEQKEAILQAAFRAPTAGNMMLYSIIEVADQEIKDKLVQTCDNQPFIAKSPYVLLFLADYQRWWDYFSFCKAEERCLELGLKTRSPQEGDLMLACCDALIAAQTAVIAAESLGIGSCYIGDIVENYEIHRDLFSLPRYVFPIAMLCFGFPRAGRSDRQVPRYDREFILHKDSYIRLNDEQLQRMAKPMEERAAGKYFKGAENLGQSFYLRKFIAEFSFEMSRSAREMIKNWTGE